MNSYVKRDKCLVEIADLFQSVQLENTRQLLKWGIQDTSIFHWLTFLTEEIGELNKAISDYEFRGDGTRDDIYKEAIQSATLCLKIAEMYKPVKLGE